MPPKLEDFTLPEVQDLLSFALGQAPSSAIPPGCSTLFLSLYNFFKEHTAEANFAAVQTLVYRSAMRFITTYRPMAQLSSFIDTVNTCRCRQSPALMRRIPKQLHDRCLARYTSLESRSLLVFIEYACRDMCRAVVAAGPSTLYRAQRRTRFPTCPEDLLPGDRNACMAMLVGWLIVPFGAPMQGLSRLVCQVLKTFRSAVLPAVLNSPAIREWTFNAGRLSRLMARRDSPHAVDINTTEIHRITGFVRDSGNLLQTLSDLCFDDELMFWAARDDPRFVGLFGTLGDSAPRAVHLLTTLARALYEPPAFLSSRQRSQQFNNRRPAGPELSRDCLLQKCGMRVVLQRRCTKRDKSGMRARSTQSQHERRRAKSRGLTYQRIKTV
jgi:hypothetical protein